jgi:hypothetical protein
MKTIAILVAMTAIAALAVVACGNEKPANDATSAAGTDATATSTAMPTATTSAK